MRKLIVFMFIITITGCSLFFPPPKKVEEKDPISKIDILYFENERIAKAKKPKVGQSKAIKEHQIETIELEAITIKPKTRILRIKDGSKIIEEKVLK